VNLKMRKAPANLQLKPKSSTDPKILSLRAKAKVKVIDYDTARYLVGIKSGVKWAAKIFVLRNVGKRRIGAKALEKEIKKRIAAGDFDKELGIRKRRGRKPGPKTGTKRGRKPGTKVRRKTGKKLGTRRSLRKISK